METKDLLARTREWIITKNEEDRKSLDPPTFLLVSLNYAVREAAEKQGISEEVTLATLERLRTYTLRTNSPTHDVFSVPESLNLLEDVEACV